MKLKGISTLLPLYRTSTLILLNCSDTHLIFTLLKIPACPVEFIKFKKKNRYSVLGLLLESIKDRSVSVICLCLFGSTAVFEALALLTQVGYFISSSYLLRRRWGRGAPNNVLQFN